MGKFLDLLMALIPSLESLPAMPASIAGPGWIFGALGTIVISLFGLSIGRTRAVISLLSIYAAFAFYMLFPYSKEAQNLIGSSLEEFWIRVGIFLASYIIIFLIFNFSFIRKRISANEYSLFGIIILSLLQIGFLASIILNILPAEISLKWSFSFYNYLATPTALFFWAIIPLPVLLFIKK